MKLLEVRDLSRYFGGLHAVNKVSFDVKRDSIKALIGPNGAGKTTLFNLVSGFIPPDGGEILFNGKPVQGLRPYQVAEQGLSRTFQHIKLFPHMSTLENVMVGRHMHGSAEFFSGMVHLPWTRREERRTRKKAMEILEFLGISSLSGQEAVSLPYGQQRITELARALACEPKLLLLDEPAAGLNMRETAEMAELIAKIKTLGVSVLLVEHDMSLVMNISDEIIVLSYGQKIAEGSPAEIQKDDEVIRVYLGGDDA
jgi:branched-chain amino acid transport system ATP-binding protein